MPPDELLSYLHEIGFRDLYLREPESTPAPVERPVAVEATAIDDDRARRAVRPAAAEALRIVAREAAECTACNLAADRQNVVFGSGPAAADLMFIGEGPGAVEDQRGLPFVGPAGELLTRIIEAIGLTRDDVYIANIVKCRPPGNRDPQPDEVQACRGWLERQVELIEPRLIVALGRVAAQTLLGTDMALGRMRGEWHAVFDVPVMVTYHPAALLRNASYKRPVWEDMKIVRDRLLELTT